jgi:hypothetical protein
MLEVLESSGLAPSDGVVSVAIEKLRAICNVF